LDEARYHESEHLECGRDENKERSVALRLRRPPEGEPVHQAKGVKNQVNVKGSKSTVPAETQKSDLRSIDKKMEGVKAFLLLLLSHLRLLRLSIADG
jgi:hypothetical protein